MITPFVLGVVALTVNRRRRRRRGCGRRRPRRPSARGLGAAPAAGLAGPLAVMVPLDFCTFGPECHGHRPLVRDRPHRRRHPVAIRLAITAIDPEAKRRRRRARRRRHPRRLRRIPAGPVAAAGAHVGDPGRLPVLAGVRTVQLSTQLVRLGAPRGVDRCVSQLHRADRPHRPGSRCSCPARQSRSRCSSASWSPAQRARADRAVGVVAHHRRGAATLTLIGLLWTASYQKVYVVTMIISFGTVAGGLVLSLASPTSPTSRSAARRLPDAARVAVRHLAAHRRPDLLRHVRPHLGRHRALARRLFGIALPNYRQNPGLAQAVVILASIWKTLGYNLLFYIAGLQTVPKDQIEAATLDGAGGFAAVPVRRDPGAVADHVLPDRHEPHLRLLRDLRHDRLPDRRRALRGHERRHVRDHPGRDPRPRPRPGRRPVPDPVRRRGGAHRVAVPFDRPEGVAMAVETRTATCPRARPGWSGGPRAAGTDRGAGTPTWP
jgi:sn-glycerol 3-phosphate transport system permease protein